MNTFYIGIDPGVKTGFAIYNKATRELQLYTLKLHKAFDMVRQLKPSIAGVVIENPNLWTHFSNSNQAKAKLQGAGSVKRDFKAWDDFLKDEGISFTSRRPDKHRNKLATDNDLFNRTTGYNKKCSEHSRVAAMLVYGM